MGGKVSEGGSEAGGKSLREGERRVRGTKRCLLVGLERREGERESEYREDRESHEKKRRKLTGIDPYVGGNSS